MAKKTTAYYVRVSSDKQKYASQMEELTAHARATGADAEWFQDTWSGRTLDRPAWRQLEKGMRAGTIGTIVVWRLDRLGRTASGLTKLFDELQERGINLVSLKDGVDLSTPAGRLMANVLASIAQFETECRGERVKAGQAAARAAGKTWGGSRPGTRRKVTAAAARTVRKLYDDGEGIASIGRIVRLSRPTIYSILNEPVR